MLRWLRTFLFEGGEYNEIDAVTLWGAICLAFFLLLRASEYLVQNNKSWSRSRVVRASPRRGRGSKSSNMVVAFLRLSWPKSAGTPI